MWILSFQAVAYYGKIAIHPTSLSSVSEMMERMAVGPVPGIIMLLIGVGFHGSWIALALITYQLDKKKHRTREGVGGMG
jgi:uncharacterized membrane protein